jgi:hypothetical protein
MNLSPLLIACTLFGALGCSNGSGNTTAANGGDPAASAATNAPAATSPHGGATGSEKGIVKLTLKVK